MKKLKVGQCVIYKADKHCDNPALLKVVGIDRVEGKYLVWHSNYNLVTSVYPESIISYKRG